MQFFQFGDRGLNDVVLDMPTTIFNQDDELYARLLRSDTFIPKPLMLLATNICDKLLYVFLCVNADGLVCRESIVPAIKLGPPSFDPMSRKPFLFEVMLALLLS